MAGTGPAECMDSAKTPKAPEAMAEPVIRPKDAATIILVRRQRRKLYVLMGMRHSRHAFMPDRYVFPGGRVDRADH